jgi:hypothetical protein
MNIQTVIDYLDEYLSKHNMSTINPVDANAILEKAGLLKDNDVRKGKPLRELLTAGKIPHAYQAGGKGSEWIIPHSSTSISESKNFSSKSVVVTKSAPAKKIESRLNVNDLKHRLNKAREKYKPDNIKYLLIAEAAPDSLDRFFYYENVKQHDYLFLGVAQALYPHDKDEYLSNSRNPQMKTAILNQMKSNGFYLLDLSELPLSLMTRDLASQLPVLGENIKAVANSHTWIILIKATVYDCAFEYLKTRSFNNFIDVRIPFPGQGGQKLFQERFKEALQLAGW